MAKAKVKSNLTNFKTIKRQLLKYKDASERVKSYKEFLTEYDYEHIKTQASRCQNCGIPFCHSYGCPVDNLIPDWNELVYQNRWEEALELLHSTNNLPEVTGRLCPAPCEESCTLNLELGSVAIRHIELTIIEKGFENNWVKPQPPKKRTGKKIAVIGSGPAGIPLAQDLNRMGHTVTLFEKDEKIGGFLRYGIPDFKMEKSVIDRRVKQMTEEGVIIKTGVNVGVDVTVEQLQKEFDAIAITTGSRDPRDLKVEGRELKGIHFATDFLMQQNRINDGMKISAVERIEAKGKHVIVIGGGDTGADCVGTSNRQGAKSVSQWEILPKPSEKRADDTPWPMYAKMLRTSTSHDEGCERRWLINTKKLTGKNGQIDTIHACEVEWTKDETGRFIMKEVPGTEFQQPADLVLLAMGFLHPVHDNLITKLGLEFDKVGNIKTTQYGFGKTSVDKVYAAGDCSRGQSLIVWAISYGKKLAQMINEDLMKK